MEWLEPWVRTLLRHARAVHLVLFYFRGVYRQLAHRALAVRYFYAQPALDPEVGQADLSSRPNYRLLGYLSLLQLAVS